QRWRRLLFLHWAWDPEVIGATLPDGLNVDGFQGSAYVGIVPFAMEGVRPRGLPVVPGLSDFRELNLRTYVVDARGRPGVWFYSLDAENPIAVWLAQRLFHLPYRVARLNETVDADGRIAYRSQRVGTDVRLDYAYVPKGARTQAEPGSLEFFLVERYRLFAHDDRNDRLITGKIHHAPYAIQDAEVETYDPRLFALDGLPMPSDAPDHVCYSPGVDVRVFRPQTVVAGGSEH
ncbi:MAG: YqjF family protein, partial [Candidatus Bipolaricaulia bacterium]